MGDSGLILHYDGTDWAAMNAGIFELFDDVWGTHSANVFVVGARGTVMHYNGRDWYPMVSNTSKFLDSVWGDGMGKKRKNGSSCLVRSRT